MPPKLEPPEERERRRLETKVQYMRKLRSNEAYRKKERELNSARNREKRQNQEYRELERIRQAQRMRIKRHPELRKEEKECTRTASKLHEIIEYLEAKARERMNITEELESDANESDLESDSEHRYAERPRP